MERHLLLKKIEEQLTSERYEHTIRVADTAILLAKRFGAKESQAELAALLHDYAKNRSGEEMKQIIQTEKLPEVLLLFQEELWHAPVGAYLVEKEVGITDEEVLQAIASHTTGGAAMTLLEKIIYLADYMEPGRDFPGVDRVRLLAESDLDGAVFQAIQQTIVHLVEKKHPIYPDTLGAYNDFALLPK